MSARGLTIIAVGALLASACQRGEAPQPAASVTPTSSTNHELVQRLEKLEGDIVALRLRISALEPGDAEISTSGAGYGVARTKFGPFTVVAREITPHLDGYKVKLSVGNLTSATFHGAKIKVEWGPPFEASKLDDYIKNRKEKEFSVTAVFQPGSYSIIDVVLVPAKPEEVRSISVRLTFDELSLRR